jgi:hypothetical protein
MKHGFFTVRAATVIVLLLLPLVLGAQDAAAPAEPAELPRGWGNITFGIGLEELKDALKNNGIYFMFREDRDVSFVPGRVENLVDVAGRGFVRRAFFQLKDTSLSIITISCNTDRIDYYTVFSKLREKYGEPKTLDPGKALWENDDTLLSLERPLTIKYIDKHGFQNDDAKPAQAAPQRGIALRDDFLDEF